MPTLQRKMPPARPLPPLDRMPRIGDPARAIDGQAGTVAVFLGSGRVLRVTTPDGRCLPAAADGG